MARNLSSLVTDCDSALTTLDTAWAAWRSASQATSAASIVNYNNITRLYIIMCGFTAEDYS